MTKWMWLFALSAACGDNLIEEPAPPPTSPFVEAAHGPVPQLVSLGGPVLHTPRSQPIFFTGDAAFQAKIEDFGVQLNGSAYWKSTTSEYGVGAITSLPAIVSSDPVPTSSAALTAWLAAKLDGTHAAEGWPATVDEQTVYSVFLPDGAVIHDPDGDSCDSYGAYHDETMGAHGESIVYALMPRCHYTNLLDDLTSSYSHELIEAATDPYVETDGAFGDADPDNYVMAYTPAAETGDYCEYLDVAYQRLVGDYLVQRTWSNAAALAGKDPCVPALGPYAAAVPMFTEQAKLDDFYTGSAVMTRAVSVPQGTSKTIDIQLISSVPTDAFTVEAIDLAAQYGGSPEVTFAWDSTTGKNGDVRHLTITRAHAGTTLPGGGSEIMLEAKLGTQVVSQWWGYVAK